MQEFNYILKKALLTGLRPTENNRRGVQALVLSTGVYPQEGALQSLEPLTALDISSLDPAPVFPFPQLFELKNGLTIVCTASEIYSYASLTLLLELGGLTPGHCWTVADFNGFAFLANGKQTVYYNAQTKTFTPNDDFGMSSCSSVCNFNGQLVVTAPNSIV